MASYKVIDPRGNEVDPARIGFIATTDDRSRKHITVKNRAGEAENVGLIEANGSIEPQPGYQITAE